MTKKNQKQKLKTLKLSAAATQFAFSGLYNAFISVSLNRKGPESFSAIV